MPFNLMSPIAIQSTSRSSADVGTEDIGANAVMEQTVRSMLAEASLDRTAYLTVVVRDGVVTLGGTTSDALWLARFKNKVTSALPSVSIDDQVEWVVPDCGIGFA